MNVVWAIEGYLDPKEPLRDEGPFGDHTGYYTLPQPYPAYARPKLRRGEGPCFTSPPSRTAKTPFIPPPASVAGVLIFGLTRADRSELLPRP